MAKDCIFCKIVDGQIPSKLEFEDDFCIAFHDIRPRASVHLLIIPKKHIATMKDLETEDEKIMGRVMKVASDVAKKHLLDHYRLSINVGKEAGQEIFHIHVHVMSVD